MHESHIEMLEAAIHAWRSAGNIREWRTSGPVRYLMSQAEADMMKKAIDIVRYAGQSMETYLKEMEDIPV